MSTTLAAALARAMMAVAGVEKGARNKFHGYDYVSADQMVAHCRAALANEGIAVVPTSHRINAIRIPYVEEGKSGRKEKEAPASIVCEYLVMGHGEAYQMASEVPLCPEAGRPIDKAVFAAKTEALGYVLRDLLLVPRGEGIDDISGRPDDDRPVRSAESRDKAPPADERADAMAQLTRAAEANGLPMVAIEAFVADKMLADLKDLTPEKLRGVARRLADDAVQKQIWAAYAGPGTE